LAHARQTILGHYRQMLDTLRRTLSPSRKRVAVSQNLQARLDEYETRLDFHVRDRVDEPSRDRRQPFERNRGSGSTTWTNGSQVRCVAHFTATAHA